MVTQYFDASALVKMLLSESGSEESRTVWDQAATPATSVITYAECRAGLAAAYRAERLSTIQYRSAVSMIDDRFESMSMVECGESLSRLAGSLAEQHRLRGFDALHLASALAAGPGTLMVTWDRALLRAASSAGLATAGVVP